MIDPNDAFKPAKKWNANTIYDQEMPYKAFEALSTGLSREATAGALGISKKTIYEWIKIYPEFADAVDQGLAAGQMRWERLGQNPNHDQFDAKVYSYTMGNIYRMTAPTNGTVNLIGIDAEQTFGLDNNKHGELIARVLTDNAKRQQE